MLRLQRFEDWPERLAAYVDARAFARFDWGFSDAPGDLFHDCCTFSAGGVIAITGADPMADLRGYANASEAARVLAPGLTRLMDQRLPAIDVSAARRGDVGLADIDGRSSLLLFVNDGLVGPGLTHLITMPRSFALRAWAVGDVD